jgi:hypothetical protein
MDPLENLKKREGEKYVGEEHLTKINVELFDFVSCDN